MRGSLAGIRMLLPSCKGMRCPTGAQILLHLKQLAMEAWFFTWRFAAELQGVAQPRQPPQRAPQQLEEGTLLFCKALQETRTGRNRADERQRTSSGKKKYGRRKFGGAAQHLFKLPKEEVVPSPSLEVFKTRLEKALSNLVQPWGCLGQQVRPEAPKVPPARVILLK